MTPSRLLGAPHHFHPKTHVIFLNIAHHLFIGIGGHGKQLDESVENAALSDGENQPRNTSCPHQINECLDRYRSGRHSASWRGRPDPQGWTSTGSRRRGAVASGGIALVQEAS